MRHSHGHMRAIGRNILVFEQLMSLISVMQGNWKDTLIMLLLIFKGRIPIYVVFMQSYKCVQINYAINWHEIKANAIISLATR